MRCVIGLAICITGLLAQEFRATLTGKITDPTDAPIAGATVTAVNTGTNQQSVAKSDARGNYTIPFLPPGEYSVTVEMDGFRKVTRGGIELNVNQSATLDFKLELGALAQEVTVTADEPLLEQSNADRGGLIDEQAVKEYPLNAAIPLCSRCWWRAWTTTAAWPTSDLSTTALSPTGA